MQNYLLLLDQIILWNFFKDSSFRFHRHDWTLSIWLDSPLLGCAKRRVAPLFFNETQIAVCIRSFCWLQLFHCFNDIKNILFCKLILPHIFLQYKHQECLSLGYISFHLSHTQYTSSHILTYKDFLLWRYIKKIHWLFFFYKKIEYFTVIHSSKHKRVI